MVRLPVVLCVAVTLAGCLQAQRPVRIKPPTSGDAVGHVSRALVSEGLTPEKVDSNSGIMMTRWKQNGFCAHPQSQKAGSAILSTRHVVTVGPSDVTMRIEAQCCLGGSIEVGDTLVRGNCVERDGVTESEQAELDALGKRLEAALASTDA